ncbi:hypothetical protein BC834DRAFT_970791 [Gloeopeniophorella convolvens]|nr:hypothetical protein BC834DRAFT_970791 [Gloeopeniophorella convolvens]
MRRDNPRSPLLRHSNLSRFQVPGRHSREARRIPVSCLSSDSTKAPGLLSSVRRTNVMLTRCQRGMYILSSRAFLAGNSADSLVGKMAAELGTRPGAWLTRADLEAAKFE